MGQPVRSSMDRGEAWTIGATFSATGAATAFITRHTP
jgi:hypothetical protein